MAIQKAKFSIGDIVKHKHFEFRGVIYDVDFEFNNSEEWYQSIPKNVRPRKDQPFYHLLAENDEITYEAYVCLLYTSPSPRDLSTSRMPSSA